MEDRRRWGRQRKIEARREERESRRSFLKHYYHNPWRLWALVLDYLTLVKVEVLKKPLKHQNERLKALILIPKFCNGLIGVSLTDSLPAPLVN
ncbi:hypothetical protein QUA03_27625 [Microcoleus sp. S36b_A4]|uniref:hypothetical protein n=1 Tax=Microcoleus sp. S36b_A4 TaxID=3055420 RepID=UPI002FD67195